MEALGARRGDLQDMVSDERGRVRLITYSARGLIGFQSDFMTMTRGTGLMSHVSMKYAAHAAGKSPRAATGLISAEQGEAVAYAL